MLAARILAAAVMTLTATAASAQLRTPKSNLPKVNFPNGINPNIRLPNSVQNQSGLLVPNSATERLTRPDLTVTRVRVVAGDRVEITVANIGRSATTVTVELRAGSSGTGDLSNPTAIAKFTVPPLAVGQQKVFTTTDDKLVRRARQDRTTSQGVIFLAANVDAGEQVVELQEANNLLTVTTK